MKKKIILLSIVLLLFTGCDITRLDTTNISKNIKTLLSQKTKLYNVQYDGYKYYLPKGISFINKDDYNALLRDQFGNVYYVYVDVISYYHKIENTYKVNKDSHYSQKIDYLNKTGFLQIDEYAKKNKYFVQFVFNYVKIEAYVSKDNLTDVITNMCYILRSFKYNDSVLESLIGEDVLDYKEEDFTLFKSDSSKETYMDVVKRSENEDYSKFLEDEKIDLDY
ncbi:MAG: hypothetical protein IJG68_04780 [Bacilli bacterium]|nr:hypothetical protein [Bacilli bacterium]